MDSKITISAWAEGCRDGAKQRYVCKDEGLQKPTIANLGGMAIEWVMGSLTLLGSIATSLDRIADALEKSALNDKRD